MKTTYLINSIQPDGSTALVETSAEHWREITENNKLLSKSDRRYFITDIISESGAFDCMIMEVTYAEYVEWNAARSQEVRNRMLRKTYQHLSIDAGNIESIVAPTIMEDEINGSVLIAELRDALLRWNKWAVPVLHMYLEGQERDAATFVMAQCNVSQATAYRYIAQFKEFVKNFLST